MEANILITSGDTVDGSDILKKKQLRLVVYLPFFLRLLVHPKGGDFSHIIFLCEVIRNDSTTYKSPGGGSLEA